jgi:hypothetical protein
VAPGRRAISGLLRAALGLVLLLGAWAAATAVAAIFAYRLGFAFDAMNTAHWQMLYADFLAGATVPFDFAATGAGLACVWALGTIALASRRDDLLNWLSDWAPRVPWPPVRLALVSTAGQRRRSRRVESPAFEPARAPALLVRLVARFRAAKAARPARSEPRLAPSLSSDLPHHALEPPPPARVETGAASAVDRAEAPAVGDADRAAFGRAMAIFEVWVEPPPDWMRETLGEELAALSAEGWRLFAAAGPASARCLDVAAAHRLLPEAEDVRDAIETLRVAENEAPAAGQAVAGDTASAAGVTLGAAWLCELLDQFEALEGWRHDAPDPPAFEARWGMVANETRQRLDDAMGAMTEDDWASLDRYPARAGRVRVLTDRLREAFREERRRGTDGPADAVCPEPSADGNFPILFLPRDEGPCLPESAAQRLHRILRDRDCQATVLAGSGPAADGQAVRPLLVRRPGLSLVVCLEDLGGGLWHSEGDGLRPWCCGEAERPSPCRVVWQQIALLRSFGRVEGRIAGLAVIANGGLADEAGLVAALSRQRRRTGVDLAWLDADGPSLPSLNQRLTALLHGDSPDKSRE